MGANANNESKRFRYAFFIKHKYNIQYCQASGSYTLIYFNNYDPEKASYRIGCVEEELNDGFFIRCHNSYIVNIYCILCICNGKNKLILSSGEEIPITRKYKNELIELLSKEFVTLT